MKEPPADIHLPTALPHDFQEINQRFPIYLYMIITYKKFLWKKNRTYRPIPLLSGIPEGQCFLCLFDSLFAFLTHFSFVIQEMGEEDGNELGALDSPGHLHLFRLGIAVQSSPFLSRMVFKSSMPSTK